MNGNKGGTYVNVVVVDFMAQAVAIRSERSQVTSREISHDKTLSAESDVDRATTHSSRRIQSPQQVSEQSMDQDRAPIFRP